MLLLRTLLQLRLRVRKRQISLYLHLQSIQAVRLQPLPRLTHPVHTGYTRIAQRPAQRRPRILHLTLQRQECRPCRHRLGSRQRERHFQVHPREHTRRAHQQLRGLLRASLHRRKAHHQQVSTFPDHIQNRGHQKDAPCFAIMIVLSWKRHGHTNLPWRHPNPRSCNQPRNGSLFLPSWHLPMSRSRQTRRHRHTLHCRGLRCSQVIHTHKKRDSRCV